MRLFKNKKFKENQADKIAKDKKKNTIIKPSGYINTDYILVDVSIKSMYDLLDKVKENTGYTKVLGTARIAQRVSQLIIAVRKDTDDIAWDIAGKYGIKKLAVSESYSEVKDLYFIIGTIRDFYCYCLECHKRKIPSKSAATFTNWLKKFDSEMFTVEQYDSMGWNNYHAGSDYIEEDIDSDMINLIDSDTLKKYELSYITVSGRDNIDLRTDIMNLSDYFLCTGGLTGIAVINGANMRIYQELAKMVVSEKSESERDNEDDEYTEAAEDDMTACEFVD